MPEAAKEERVGINLDELIIGRPLNFPIRDAEGVLLLAEGKVITSDFKRLLRQHGVKQVHVDKADADSLRVSVSLAIPTNELGFDCQLAKQLDSVIDSGLLAVTNRGPAVSESRVMHGRKAYDEDKRQHLEDQHKSSSESLNNMLRQAARGGKVAGSQVTQLAAMYLSEMSDDTDCVMNAAMKATNDSQLSDHCLKMSMIGMAIAIEMGMDEENCRRVCVAGLVHDWGMARIDEEIRKAPRALTQDEFFEIRKHPIYTAEILERTTGMPTMVPIIAYQVHERPNGLGYPKARAGDRIHMFARILGVADTFAALTAPRPQRPPLMPYAAMECLVRLAKTRDVDPTVVRALLRVMSLFPIGSLVVLSDGSVAQVIRRNGEDYAHPIVQVIQDPSGEPVPRDVDEAVVDLANSELSVMQALPTPGKDETANIDEYLMPERKKSKRGA